MEEPSAEKDDSWEVLVKAKEKVRLRKKGDWFRVTKRGRRLLLKHLNTSKSAASQGPRVLGNKEK